MCLPSDKLEGLDIILFSLCENLRSKITKISNNIATDIIKYGLENNLINNLSYNYLLCYDNINKDNIDKIKNKFQYTNIKYKNNIDKIINKLLIIYNLFRVTTKNNLLKNKIRINEKENIIFKCRFKTQKIIFINKKKFIINMQELHNIYWEWIDNNKIDLDRDKFISLCSILWKKTITTDYSHILSFKYIYNKYKNIERTIPCSYAFILNKNKLSKDIQFESSNNYEFNNDSVKCLLIRHYNTNKWSLPGGKIESNETYTDTLKREIIEELGIDCSYEIENSLKTQKYIDCKTEYKKFRCYTFNLNDNIKLITNSPYEIGEIKWFDINKLPKNKSKLLNYLILNKCKLLFNTTNNFN